MSGSASPATTNTLPASTSTSSATINSEAPGSPDPLLKVLRSGGLCAGGQVCNDEIVIGVDGSWVRTPSAEAGVLPADELEHLRTLIDSKSNGLSSLKVAGTPSCPSAADGMDVTYTFHSGSDVVALSNCDVDLGQTNELLQLVADIVNEIAG